MIDFTSLSPNVHSGELSLGNTTRHPDPGQPSLQDLGLQQLVGEGRTRGEEERGKRDLKVEIIIIWEQRSPEQR